jgi:NodT family efflux transporter outer membrane factor (OMF) lipoprotein
MKNLKLTSAILLSLALSACSLTPTYQRPDMAVPAGWSNVAGVGASSGPSDAPFWRELGSEELNRIMKVALAQNLDLEAALHRIAQARGQARVAGAPLYPALEASGGSSRTIQDPRDATSARGVGSLSYEIDLWGKNRSNAAAANQRARATEFDRDALQLIVSSDTATFYTQLLSLNERIRIAENNLRTAEEVLRIIEARYRAGSVSGLEVAQQRVAVNSFRSSLSSLAEQRATTFNALAILVGQAPQDFQPPRDTLASLKAPFVELTPPATLLTARPDIEGSEALLRAANADIGAARAAFFPSLKLGVDTSIAAGFGGPAAAATSLANSVLAPIFTGGRLRGNLEAVTARQKELAAQYRKTVLTAFQEVEDALAALKSTDEQSEISRQTVQESQNAYDIAKARFDAGAIDYLTLLETQRSLFQAQDDQIAISAAQLQAFIQLRKALGG